MSNSRRNSEIINDWMWIIPLVLAVFVSIYYTLVFIDPSLWILGAKPEPVPIALIPTATPRPSIPATNTPVPVPTTWTPQPTPTELPTNTPRSPTPTRPSATPFLLTLPPTITPTPTATRHPFPFRLLDDEIDYTSYFFDSTCNWLGIAGEVWDLEGEPLLNISVVLNGGPFNNVVTASGSRPDYADSGWEHFLDVQPKEGAFTIQLWNRGTPVSELVEVRTFKDCRKNLAYLIFQQVWEEYTP